MDCGRVVAVAVVAAPSSTASGAREPTNGWARPVGGKLTRATLAFFSRTMGSLEPSALGPPTAPAAVTALGCWALETAPKSATVRIAAALMVETTSGKIQRKKNENDSHTGH